MNLKGEFRSGLEAMLVDLSSESSEVGVKGSISVWVDTETSVKGLLC